MRNTRGAGTKGRYPYVSTAKCSDGYVGEPATMRAARASIRDQSISSYGPWAGVAGQGKQVGNMQAGPWTAWGARVSLPSIRVQKGYVGWPAGGKAARASLLDYTQWEFTVAVSRVSEAGRIGRVKRAGIRREPAARVAGTNCVTLGDK